MYQTFGSFKKTLYICQRQKVTIGYPGKFPERASRIRHYPILQMPIMLLATPLSAGSKTLSTLLHFSLPKVLFDYPGRIPRGQDHIDTTQEKGWAFLWCSPIFFVIIRCLKNKTQIFLVVCKNPCTFAAKLVFHNLYNHRERNQQRLLIPLFWCPQLPPNRLVTNLRYQVALELTTVQPRVR